MKLIKDLFQTFAISLTIAATVLFLIFNQTTAPVFAQVFDSISNQKVQQTEQTNVSTPEEETITKEDPKKTKFIEKITKRIDKETGTYGIVIKNLNTQEEILINSDEIFPPASTFKVYTAILVLKDIENGKLSWNKQVTLTEGLWCPGSGTYFQKSDLGKTYTVKYLLERMIVQSDNTAQSMLFSILTRNAIKSRLKTDLMLEKTSLEEFETTPEEMATTLERLYKRELLNEELSDHLISLMAKGFTTNRIKTGVPEGTKVANKGGSLPGSKHDIGIIFGEESDYLLVVYTKGIVEEDAIDTIQDISKFTWQYFDN